jgi:hypothetical protein
MPSKAAGDGSCLQASQCCLHSPTWALTSPDCIPVPCLPVQIPLYSKAGFSLLGPSDVVHGQDQWFEMAHVLQQQEC